MSQEQLPDSASSEEIKKQRLQKANYTMNNNYVLGEELFQEYMGLYPNDHQGLYVFVTHLILRKRYEEAISYGKQLLELKPTDALYQHILGYCFYNLEHYAYAEQRLSIAAEIKPEDPIYQRDLGFCLTKLNRHQEALPHLQAAVEFDPTNAEYHHAIGCCFVSLNQPDEALQHLKAAVEFAPKSAKYNHKLGKYYSELNRHQEALAFLKKAVKLAPGNDTYKRDLEHHSNSTKCNTKPVNAQVKALPSAPVNKAVDGSQDEAKAARDASKKEAAKKAAQKASEEAAIKEAVEKLYKEAVDLIREVKGQDSAAKEAPYRKAIELVNSAIGTDPKNAKLHGFIGELYYALDSYDDAISSYKQAIKLDPQKYSYHNNLGLAYEAQANYEDAKAAYANAIANSPNDSECWYNYADTLTHFNSIDDQVSAFVAYSIALDPCITTRDEKVKETNPKLEEILRKIASYSSLACHVILPTNQPKDISKKVAKDIGTLLKGSKILSISLKNATAINCAAELKEATNGSDVITFNIPGITPNGTYRNNINNNKLKKGKCVAISKTLEDKVYDKIIDLVIETPGFVEMLGDLYESKKVPTYSFDTLVAIPNLVNAEALKNSLVLNYIFGEANPENYNPIIAQRKYGFDFASKIVTICKAKLSKHHTSKVKFILDGCTVAGTNASIFDALKESKTSEIQHYATDLCKAFSREDLNLGDYDLNLCKSFLGAIVDGFTPEAGEAINAYKKLFSLYEADETLASKTLDLYAKHINALATQNAANPNEAATQNLQVILGHCERFYSQVQQFQSCERVVLIKALATARQKCAALKVSAQYNDEVEAQLKMFLEEEAKTPPKSLTPPPQGGRKTMKFAKTDPQGIKWTIDGTQFAFDNGATIVKMDFPNCYAAVSQNAAQEASTPLRNKIPGLLLKFVTQKYGDNGIKVISDEYGKKYELKLATADERIMCSFPHKSDGDGGCQLFVFDEYYGTHKKIERGEAAVVSRQKLELANLQALTGGSKSPGASSAEGQNSSGSDYKDDEEEDATADDQLEAAPDDQPDYETSGMGEAQFIE